MKNVTGQLAQFIVESKYSDLPSEVVNEARLVFLDAIGCALGGLATDRGRLAVDFARRSGGRPESSIVGSGGAVPSTCAAFANGELINALDYDPMLRPAIHVAPFAIPPALAMGETKSISGKDLILAIVLAHEITCRVASGLVASHGSLPPASGKALPPVHGYSSNAFGAVAGAGKIAGLNPEKMARALGIAGYCAPLQTGTQWQHSGTDALLKYASAGWVAQAGVTAALLADSGYTGDENVLDGENSFWRVACSPEWHPEAVLKDLGREWHMVNARYKFFPCCGVILSPLICFMSIIEKNHLQPRDIDQVKVLMHPLADLPLWKNREIDNEVQAQFSVAYVLALAAFRKAPAPDWQTPANMKDPAIREFMKKITQSVHPDYSRLEHPTADMSRVEVLARGKTYTEEKTGREAPIQGAAKQEKIVQKFRGNASAHLSDALIKEVTDMMLNLDQLPGISSLLKKLA